MNNSDDNDNDNNSSSRTTTTTNKKLRPTPPSPPLQILTVGEGDFSLSLALVRAYGSQICLTATTIVPSRAHLRRLYPGVDVILDELMSQQEEHVTVLYGVDATQLHKQFGQDPKRAPSSDNISTTTTTTTTTTKTRQFFDLILFYHPHLGITKDKTEVEQAKRHECLVAHYLASAAACLKDDNNNNSKVHLCLCGTQPITWKVRATAARLGLTELPPGRPTTAAPWHDVLHYANQLTPAPSKQMAAPRKFRNGKQGSRHWLGKYGYCHRRTQGELYDGAVADANVQGSVDLLFQKRHVASRRRDDLVWDPQPLQNDNDDSTMLVCPICLAQFSSTEAYQAHLQAPALPCDVELVQSVTAAAAAAANNNNNPPKQSSSLATVEAAVNTQQQETSGIRLRKYLQKHFGKSRSAASQLIHAGKVFLNGQVALDSARLVFPDTMVEVKHEENDSPPLATGNPLSGTTSDTSSNANTTVKIETVARLDGDIQIVWKPVGMRTKGHFGGGTLEELMTRQEGCRMESLTRLDTGLSGLCLLHKAATILPRTPPTSVRHRLTALILGKIHDSWSSTGSSDSTLELLLQPDKQRRWGSGVANCAAETDEKEQQEQPCYKVDVRILESLSIKAQGGSDDDDKLTMSTIQIDVMDQHSSIGSLLTFALRKQYDLRVVGDRFSNKEYAKLPRSIRNRIKQKICLGCTGIFVNGKEIQYPIPDKWMANFWNQFLQNAE